MKLKNECTFEAVPENIIRLKELTKALEFSGILSPASTRQVKEIDMRVGASFMVGLYKTDNIGIARNFASENSEFPEHFHNEWELLIVYSGEMHLTIEGETHTLKEKDFFYILPQQKHKAYFPVNTWFIAITMPASDSWPDTE